MTSIDSTMLLPPSPAPAIRIRKTRRLSAWMIPVMAILAIGAAAFTLNPWRSGEVSTVSGQFYTVTPMDLEVKINKDGELQAISYTDIKSEVEGAAQILQLVAEGTTVKKGDQLVRLDTAALQTRKEQIDLDLKKADSAVKIAKEMKGIQESQNSANLEAAEVALELARIELEQYLKGTYKQQLEDAITGLDMAKLTLKTKQEDLAQTKQLYERGFVTVSDIKKGEIEIITASNAVRKAETTLLVLEKYTNAMDTAKLKSAVAQAEQKLARTLKENASLLSQKQAELEEKEHAFNLLKNQATKLQEQLDFCIIRAPEDGLVIYSSSIERRERDPIQEGTTIRQSQWLIRLPDVKLMKAVLKIPESQKSKLDERVNQRATVKILGYPRPVGATVTKVSVLPDNTMRWWSPDLREYPVELTLDETPPGVKPGVRVENAEIFIAREEQVVAIPLAAVYSVGKDSYAFARTASGDVKEKKITLGTANETHVKVDGLNAGDQVLLLQPGQGRTLLEKAGIKISDTNAARGGPPERKRNGNGGPGNREGQAGAVGGPPDGVAGGSAAGTEGAVAEPARRESTEQKPGVAEPDLRPPGERGNARPDGNRGPRQPGSGRNRERTRPEGDAGAPASK